jgi:hypothetical protein
VEEEEVVVVGMMLEVDMTLLLRDEATETREAPVPVAVAAAFSSSPSFAALRADSPVDWFVGLVMVAEAGLEVEAAGCVPAAGAFEFSCVDDNDGDDGAAAEEPSEDEDRCCCWANPSFASRLARIWKVGAEL